MADKTSVSTVRLPSTLRGRLKVLAAARNQTMEMAVSEAVELWASASPYRPAWDGKTSEECKRMHSQVDQICQGKNERAIEAAMYVLDALILRALS